MLVKWRMRRELKSLDNYPKYVSIRLNKKRTTKNNQLHRHFANCCTYSFYFGLNCFDFRDGHSVFEKQSRFVRALAEVPENTRKKLLVSCIYKFALSVDKRALDKK